MREQSATTHVGRDLRGGIVSGLVAAALLTVALVIAGRRSPDDTVHLLGMVALPLAAGIGTVLVLGRRGAHPAAVLIPLGWLAAVMLIPLWAMLVPNLPAPGWQLFFSLLRPGTFVVLGVLVALLISVARRLRP